MLNSKELYGKISEWREDKGWTENKLCDIAGVSHSMFHSWLSRGTMPKLDTLESLCYALDKPLAALLFDVDENRLTGEEIQLLSKWKKLDVRQKKVIMDTIGIAGGRIGACRESERCVVIDRCIESFHVQLSSLFSKSSIWICSLPATPYSKYSPFLSVCSS